MQECLFCKIANKQIAADIVFENDQFVVFKDVEPKATVHLLVVPKKHINSVSALRENDRELISDLIFTAKEVAKNAGLETGGYRLVFNSGSDAGQSVDHIHLHILGGSRLGPIA
ncbi:MAG TPA: histidine triad nucleotide-binding protein [bacterium]|nr:histidine triad nucleotide-binding protein [bacterium]